MKWTTATALLLALSAGGVGVAVVATREPKSPLQVLEDIRAQMDRPLFDKSSALRLLDDVMQGNRGAVSSELERDLLRTRVDLYKDLEIYGRAREDVEALLAHKEDDARAIRSEAFSAFANGDGTRQSLRRLASFENPLEDPLTRLVGFGVSLGELVSLSASVAEAEAAIEDLNLEAARLQNQEGQVFEALQRVEKITARNPNSGEAWALRGRLAERLAREGRGNSVPGIAQILRRVKKELASEQYEEASELLVGLTAREAGDTELEDLEFQLARTFSDGDEVEYRWVIENVNGPRTRFAEARTAYTEALQAEITPEAVVLLADSLERAGQLNLAIQLQIAARRHTNVALDSDAAASLLSDLATAQRTEEARALVTGWDWELGATTEFYRSAGELLFKSGDLASLNNVAEGLESVGEDTGARWALGFFRPLGALGVYPRQIARRDALNKRLGRTTDEEEIARINKTLKATSDWLDNFRGKQIAELGKFSRDRVSVEPFVQARKLAAFYLAEANRLVGRTGPERQNLKAALSDMPEHSAAAWARYAEALQRVDLMKDAEEAYSEAMSLDPTLTAELAPAWYAAGENVLTTNGTSIAALIDQTARLGTFLPNSAMGPSVKTRIAQDHLANGRYYFAIQAAREALRNHPGLVPALDVIIAAELATPEKYPVAEDVIKRIEAAGVDETVEGFLAQLEDDGLEGEWLIRAIRAAPARFGKAAVARWHLDRGEVEEARRAFDGLDGGAAPASLQLLSARLIVESGSYAEAVAELDRLDDRPQTRAAGDLLRLRAYLGLGRTDALQGHVRAMVARHPLPQGQQVLLGAIDQLAAAGETTIAYGLVEQLDQAPETRTPAFYRRRVLVDLLLTETRGPAATVESILRAEPYVEDGTPELAAILLAVGERDWTSLPRLVDRVEESRFDADPYEAAALALLGERLEEGSRAAAAGLQENPRDARWALLSAAATALVDGDIAIDEWFGPVATSDLTALLRGKNARSAQDPRDAIALFLAGRQPIYAPWTAPRLAALIESTGSAIWGPMLQIDVAASTGDDAVVDGLLEELLTKHPRFGPAHDIAVRRAEMAHPTEPLHPAVVDARARRLDSMTAQLIGDDVEIRMAMAGKLARSAQYGNAVKILLPVATSDGPKATEGRIMLSVFQMRGGEPAFAAQYLHAAAMKELGVYRDVALESLVEAIRLALASDAAPGGGRGRSRGQLTPEDGRRMLRDLRAKYPEDPLVALAELQLLDVEDGERGRRARGLLATLQQAAGDRPFNSLRPGATQAWVRFLAPVAAEVASDLVQTELVKEPGNIELFQLAGLVARIEGDTERARREYETLLAIEPRADACYALAELLVDEGASRADIDPLLAQANRLGGGSSARANYLRSIAEMHIPAPTPLSPGQARELEARRKQQQKDAEERGENRRPDPRENLEERERKRADAIVSRLQGLWQQRVRASAEIDTVELGLLYAGALTRRGTPEDDRVLLELLDELRPLVEGRLYVPQLLDALEGITRAAMTTGSSS